MQSRDTLERIIGWLHVNYFERIKVSRSSNEGRIYCISVIKPDIIPTIFTISVSTNRVVIKIDTTEHVCTHSCRSWGKKLTEILG